MQIIVKEFENCKLLDDMYEELQDPLTRLEGNGIKPLNYPSPYPLPDVSRHLTDSDRNNIN